MLKQVSLGKHLHCLGTLYVSYIIYISLEMAHIKWPDLQYICHNSKTIHPITMLHLTNFPIFCQVATIAIWGNIKFGTEIAHFFCKCNTENNETQ